MTSTDIATLEAAVRVLQAKLSDPAYRERASALELQAEHARVEEMLADLASLRAREQASGMREAGWWDPLPLHAPVTTSEAPAFDVAQVVSADDLSAFFEALVHRRVATGAAVARLRALREQLRGDRAGLRLLAATFETIGLKGDADTCLLRPSVSRTTPTLPAWLLRSSELPSLSDGLTATQRRLVERIERASPPGREPARVADLREGLDADDTNDALLALAHPALRLHPVVELFTDDGPFQPMDTRVTRVRMGPLRQWRSLPMLLINGAAGRDGTCFPGHHARHVLDAAVAVVRGQPWQAEWDRPEFSFGGKLAPNWRRVHDVVCRASITSDASLTRLTVSSIPWPHRTVQLLPQLHAAIASGELEGVRAIRDESSAHGARVVLELEHAAFEWPVHRRLLFGGFTSTEWPLVLRCNEVVGSLQTVLTAWVQARREALRTEVEQGHHEARGRLQDRLAQLEALYIARKLSGRVLAALRACVDEDEVVQALGTLLTAEARQELGSLPFPTSRSSATGFTPQQARFLNGVRRLEGYSLERIAADWAATLDELRSVPAADARIDDSLVATLTAARGLFPESRRTGVAMR